MVLPAREDEPVVTPPMVGPLKTVRFFLAKTGCSPGLAGPKALKAEAGSGSALLLPCIIGRRGRVPNWPGGGRRLILIPAGKFPVMLVGVPGCMILMLLCGLLCCRREVMDMMLGEADDVLEALE